MADPSKGMFYGAIWVENEFALLPCKVLLHWGRHWDYQNIIVSSEFLINTKTVNYDRLPFWSHDFQLKTWELKTK